MHRLVDGGLRLEREVVEMHDYRLARGRSETTSWLSFSSTGASADVIRQLKVELVEGGAPTRVYRAEMIDKITVIQIGYSDQKTVSEAVRTRKHVSTSAEQQHPKTPTFMFDEY